MVLCASQTSAMPSSLSRNLTCVPAATLDMHTHGRRNANPVKTPAVPENHLMEEQRESSEPMGRPDASRYRAFAARLNNVSLDRPDLQFAAKLASRYVATPRVVDWTILKRAARYLFWSTACSADVPMANRANNSNHLHRQRLGRRAGQQKINQWRGRLPGAPHDKVLELNTADCCTLKWRGRNCVRSPKEEVKRRGLFRY